MVKKTTKPSIKRKNIDPKSSLGILSQKVFSLAEQNRNRQTTTTNLEALQNRKRQLEIIVNSATSLVDTVQVFRLKGNDIPLTTVTPLFEKARLSILELSDRYRIDPQSALQTLKPQISSPLKPLEEILLNIWARIAQPKQGAVTLSSILSQFSQFKKTCLEIKKYCYQLEQLSHTLPQNQEEYDTVIKLQEQLHQHVAQLETTGLDLEVQRYLRNLSTGVILSELLEKPTVLEFLKYHNLLSSLMVSFRP